VEKMVVVAGGGAGEEEEEEEEIVCVVYWCSFSNPRTKCIHCDNCRVIKKETCSLIPAPDPSGSVFKSVSTV